MSQAYDFIKGFDEFIKAKKKREQAASRGALGTAVQSAARKVSQAGSTVQRSSQPPASEPQMAQWLKNALSQNANKRNSFSQGSQNVSGENGKKERSIADWLKEGLESFQSPKQKEKRQAAAKNFGKALAYAIANSEYNDYQEYLELSKEFGVLLDSSDVEGIYALDQKFKQNPDGYQAKLDRYNELFSRFGTAEQKALREASSLDNHSIQLFQSPEIWDDVLDLFDDGYDFGDGTRTGLRFVGDLLGTAAATAGDIGVDLSKGVLKTSESVADWLGGRVADVSEMLGQDDYADEVRMRIEDNMIEDLFEDVDLFLDKGSLLGHTGDAVAEGVGQATLLSALGQFGNTPLGATAITGGTGFISGWGSGEAEALQAGATPEEAKTYGMISGAADSLTEMLFGGLGKTSNALGFGKGLSSADDMLAKAVSGKISNTLAKNLVQFGIKSGAEGLEEVLAGLVQAWGKKLTYMSEEDFRKILSDENLLEQFVVGSLSSGFMQGGDLVRSTKAGRDFVTGLSEDEQAVADSVFEKEVSSLEENGEKLSGKAKAKLFDSIVERMKKGFISTDDIEAALSGETFQKYKDTTEQKNKLQAEYDELYQMKNGDKSDAQRDRQAELKAQLAQLDPGQYRSQLDEEMSRRLKDSYLAESYNERTRRGQAFQADLSQYKNETARKTVQNIMDAGVANNTNRFREFVDFIAKISGDKGIVFSVADAKKLKETGYAINDGTVNGYYDDSGITVNISSSKALNSIVGHELTHALEGTEFYETLKDTVLKYAKDKGNYDSLAAAFRRIYQGKKGYETDFESKLEREIVADLIGDYVFTDADFINSLSTEHRNVFQKLYDEIKYLVKVATAGSKEARELEKVKKLFDEAYRNTKNTAQPDGVKYSLMAFEKDGTRFVEIDQNQDRFDGHSVYDYPRIAKDIINEKFNHKVIGTDNKMYVNSAGRDEFANPSKRISDDMYEAKMRTAGELDNLLDAGTNFRNKPDGEDGHYHPDVTDGFDYFDTIFKIGNRYFKAVINIKNIAKGKLFKDVTKIEDVTQDIMSSYGNNPKSQFLRTSSIYSLSESDQNVNTEYSGENVYGADVALESREENMPADNRPKVDYSHPFPTQEDIEAMRLEAEENAQAPEDGIAMLIRGLEEIRTGNTQQTSADKNEGAPTVERPKRILTPEGRARAAVYDAEIEYSNHLSNRRLSEQRFKEEIDRLQQQYSKKKNKNTKAANDLLGRIDRLKTKMAEVNGDWERRIRGAKNRLYRARIELHKRENKNDRLSPVNQNAPDEIIAKAERITGNRDEFIADRASELYKEIAGLHTGLQAKEAASYLLDHVGKNWEPLKVALLNIRDNPNQIVNPNSAIESIAREMLDDEYQAKIYDWINALNPVANPETDVETTAQINAEVQATAMDMFDKIESNDHTLSFLYRDLKDLEDQYATINNKDNPKAADLLERIEEKKRQIREKREQNRQEIASLTERIERMQSVEYHTAKQRQYKDAEYFKWSESLVGDTSAWVDKHNGLGYALTTMDRYMRDVVRDKNGNEDFTHANAITEALKGTYSHNEAAFNRELAERRGKYAKLKITSAEDVYIQMLGEQRHNPSSDLTEETVKAFYDANKKHINPEKVDKIIAMARADYDDWIARANVVLRKQGLPEIPYRLGYFPHHTEDLTKRQAFLKKYANWQPANDDIPTSIAGMTEGFEPIRKHQSFDKHRETDNTDYSFKKGFDAYSYGILDWIYHIEDLQKRRALEHYIRYTRSTDGVKARIDAINTNEEISADEADSFRQSVYAEAKTPLNNLVVELRRGTQTLAGKKSSLDRQAEEYLGRGFYTFMSNVTKRTAANMVAGSMSAGISNLGAMFTAWAEVSPIRTTAATIETIEGVFTQDDGLVKKSDFMTNRLREADALDKSFWDHTSDVLSFVPSKLDALTTNVIWRSMYHKCLDKGMTEKQAIHEADRFAERILAGRSRGERPTGFDAKNPFIQMFTVFQQEPANTLQYLSKDIPNYIKDQYKNKSVTEQKARIFAERAAALIGHNIFNAMTLVLLGRSIMFDPLRVAHDLLRNIGFGDKDEEDEKLPWFLSPLQIFADAVNGNIDVDDKKWGEIIGQTAIEILQEIPYIGGYLGGGRVPVSSAMPYDSLQGLVTEFPKDIESESGWDIAKEILKPIFYVVLPMGGSQTKKTIEGVSMFLGDKPIDGSYTTNGGLRYPVDANVQNIAQAALFGKWANSNARDYIEQGRRPLTEEQTEEFLELDISIQDYWTIRDGLSARKSFSEKAEYIAGLDLSTEQKNLLINNLADREEDIDLEDFEKFGNWEEFDFFSKNKEKYQWLEDQGISYRQYKINKEEFDFAYSSPEKYEFLQDRGVSYRTYQNNKEEYDFAYDRPEDYKELMGEYQDRLSYLNRLGTFDKKAEYIDALDLTSKEKHILINKIGLANGVDIRNYLKYDSWDEFLFAEKNPAKYRFLQKQNVSYTEYTTNQKEYDWAYDNSEKYDFLHKNGISYKEYQAMYREERSNWNWAYENQEKFLLSQVITDDLAKYRKYTDALYDIRADKDKNGKSISGSAKKKKRAYINILPLSKEEKMILFKMEYPSHDDDNREIINYIIDLKGYTKEEKTLMLEELGFTVKDGKVSWN